MAEVRVQVLDASGVLHAGGPEVLDQAEGLTWVDVEKPDAPTMKALGARFKLHWLAIEDTLHLDQRPKLEQYEGHQFLVTQGFCAAGSGGTPPSTKADDAKSPDATAVERSDDLQLIELHTFLADRWLITVHDGCHPGLELIRARTAKQPQDTLGRGVDFLAYTLVDSLVDSNFPLLDEITDELEALEDAIFESAQRSQLRRAFDLKRTLSLMRRVMSPQRDVLALLSRPGVPNVNERTTLYFRDVYDHLVRLYEQIDMSRDLLSNALDAWLSVTANKTNDISRQLTLFASIFMPLSFVVGFFGQNFPELNHTVYFWVMIFIVVTLPVAMVWWFFRKHWF